MARQLYPSAAYNFPSIRLTRAERKISVRATPPYEKWARKTGGEKGKLPLTTPPPTRSDETGVKTCPLQTALVSGQCGYTLPHLPCTVSKPRDVNVMCSAASDKRDKQDHQNVKPRAKLRGGEGVRSCVVVALAMGRNCPLLIIFHSRAMQRSRANGGEESLRRQGADKTKLSLPSRAITTLHRA